VSGQCQFASHASTEDFNKRHEAAPLASPLLHNSVRDLYAGPIIRQAIYRTGTQAAASSTHDRLGGTPKRDVSVNSKRTAHTVDRIRELGPTQERWTRRWSSVAAGLELVGAHITDRWVTSLAIVCRVSDAFSERNPGVRCTQRSWIIVQMCFVTDSLSFATDAKELTGKPVPEVTNANQSITNSREFATNNGRLKVAQLCTPSCASEWNE
jgi:hypothetical protein